MDDTKETGYVLTEEEQEFLHMMHEENFDFDKWADDMSKAIENGEIEEAQPTKDDTDFDLDF